METVSNNDQQVKGESDAWVWKNERVRMARGVQELRVQAYGAA
jgi:hypothetical protein